MKHITLYSGFVLVLLSSGCRQVAHTNHQEQLLQATLWFQQSAELQAIFIQTYNMAETELASKMAREHAKPPAVVLDIDETVLDNSPHTARQIIDDQGFNSETWDEWCLLGQAKPLPGSVEFTQFASGVGAEVFYISNRGIHLMEATLRNLKMAGFPYADSAHIFLMTGSSGKEARRERVLETHDILMLIGDNLGDFSTVFEDRLQDGGKGAVEEYRDSLGTTFILLPNPMYGGWEQPFRAEGQEETFQRKREALESYTTQNE